MTFKVAALRAMRAAGVVSGADVARFHGSCTRIQAEASLRWLQRLGVAESVDPPRTRFDAPPRRWKLVNTKREKAHE